MADEVKSSGEPALLQATATAVVAAAISLLVSFGLPITDEQQNAILSFVAVIAPLVAGVLIRRGVVPKGNVVAVRDTAGQIVAGDAAVQTNGQPVTVTPSV